MREPDPWIALFLVAVVLTSSCLGERREDLASSTGGWVWRGTPSAGVVEEELPPGWSVRRFVVMDRNYFVDHLSATGIAPMGGESITYQTPAGDVFLVHIYIFSNATLAEEDHGIYAFKLSQIFTSSNLDLGEEGFLFRSEERAAEETFTGYLSFRRGRFFVLYSLIDVPLDPPLALAGFQDQKIRALVGRPLPRGEKRDV
jgi:hypothetical protein